VWSLPSSHNLHFFTTSLETISPHSLYDIPLYLQCHDHSPTCTLANTSSSSVQGVWTHKQNPGSCIYVRHLVAINSSCKSLCVFKFISLLRNKIFRVFMTAVEMRVVFWICTPCSVVPYVPSVSMRTTSDTKYGGSTSSQCQNKERKRFTM